MTKYSTIEVCVETSDGPLSPKESLDLRKRFLRMGVEHADFAAVDETPEEAKAGEILTLATVTLALLPALYPDVVKVLKEWTGLSKDRRVKIRKKNSENEMELEYNIDDVSLDEIRKMMAILEKEIE